MDLMGISRDVYCFVIQVRKKSVGEPVRVIVILRSAFFPEADSGRRHMFIDSFSEGVHKEFELLRGSITPQKAAEWFGGLEQSQWEIVSKPEDFKYLRRKMKEEKWSWPSFTTEEIKNMTDGFGLKSVHPVESQNPVADSIIRMDAPRDFLERWQHGRNFVSGLSGDYAYAAGKRQQDGRWFGETVSILAALIVVSLAALLYCAVYCVFVWPFKIASRIFKGSNSEKSR